MERDIRSAFDKFEDIYLRESAWVDGGISTNVMWLLRQRIGRLCEDVVRVALRNHADAR